MRKIHGKQRRGSFRRLSAVAAAALLLSLTAGATPGWAALPGAYDLRDAGRVTAIRDQGRYGACWAFGTMASLESNYLTQLQQAGVAYDAADIDFSERNLA